MSAVLAVLAFAFGSIFPIGGPVAGTGCTTGVCVHHVGPTSPSNVVRSGAWRIGHPRF